MKAKQYEATELSQALGINRSSLYFRSQGNSKEDEIKRKIEEIKRNHKAYGYRRITLELKSQGLKINHKRILRVMKKYDLINKNRRRKKFEKKIKAIYLDTKIGINLIRDIEINKPYQVIQTDFTELVTIGGIYKLIVYLCNYTKYAINWKICRSESAEAAISCIKPVLQKTNEESYIHQDQGSAYTSDEYMELLIKKNVYISYSEKGTPTNNGEMESFFGRFKEEWSDTYVQSRNISELKKTIRKAMIYYNKERIHTTIKDKPRSYLLKKLLPTRSFLKKTV